MANDLVISGLAELNSVLQQLPVKVENKILRGALRAGAKVFLLEARKRVPVQSGALRRSLRIKTSSRRGVVTATMIAGDSKTNKTVHKKKGGGIKVTYSNAWYAHLVEFGTAAHYVKSTKEKYSSVRIDKNGKPARRQKSRVVSGVKHPGAKPQPFMRPAFKAGQRAAVDAVANYIRNRLAKEASSK